MITNYYLGIDTSAYTTSIAVIDDDLNILFDERKTLEVEIGKRGLRQQEAIFQHINNLPLLIKKLTNKIDVSMIRSIGVSISPRNITGSYMPVFKISQNIGNIVANLLDTDYQTFSHQQGHIGSGVIENELIYKDEFLTLHISGGTTELLLVKRNCNSYDVEIVGGSKDISFGQLIDRIGVKLGLRFPCGKIMNEKALNGTVINQRFPVSTTGSWVNLSGLETYLMKLIDKDIYEAEDIFISLFCTISKYITTMINNSLNKFSLNDVLIVGGVASNSILRENLTKYYNDSYNIYFPRPKLCTDNAVGLALLSKINSKNIIYSKE